MSIRSAKRQMAKARLKALGVDRVNRVMSRRGWKEPAWRRVLTGDLAKKAEAALMKKGEREHRIRTGGGTI